MSYLNGAAAASNCIQEWRLCRQVVPGAIPKMTEVSFSMSGAQEQYEIGRLAGNGRFVVHPTTRLFVSKRHCQLTFRNGVWRVHDLHSLNHTFLNGDIINEIRELRHGDYVGLGVGALDGHLEEPFNDYYVFRFEQVGLPVPATSVTPEQRMPMVFKKEIPDVITLDSDSDEDDVKPGPSQVSGIDEETKKLEIAREAEAKKAEEDKANKAKAAMEAQAEEAKKEKDNETAKKIQQKEEAELLNQKALKKERERIANEEKAKREEIARKMNDEKIREEEKKRAEEKLNREKAAKKAQEEANRLQEKAAEEQLRLKEIEKKEAEEKLRREVKIAEEAKKLKQKKDDEQLQRNLLEKNEIEEKLRLEAKIAEEQYNEILSGNASASSSRRASVEIDDVVNVASPPSISAEDLEKIRQKQLLLTERRKRKMAPQQQTNPPAKTSEVEGNDKKYRRILSLSPSSSSSNDEDDLNYLGHIQNPYAPRVEAIPAKCRSAQTDQFIQKVIVQFEASCQRNNVSLHSSNAREPKQPIQVKRKTPSEEFSTKSEPKRQRAELEPTSAPIVQSVGTNEIANAILHTPATPPVQILPPPNPAVPEMLQNTFRTPANPPARLLPTNNATGSRLAQPPNVVPAQNTAASTAKGVLPVSNRPKQPKDLNCVTRTIFKKHPCQAPPIVIEPHILPKRRGHGTTFPTPSAALTSREAVAPNSSGSSTISNKERLEKLQQIAVKQRQVPTIPQKQKPPAPFMAKTTKISRADRLLQEMVPAAPPPSTTKEEKPKAAVAPNTSREKGPTPTVEQGVLDAIIANMGNNRLSQVIEKPRAKMVPLSTVPKPLLAAAPAAQGLLPSAVAMAQNANRIVCRPAVGTGGNPIVSDPRLKKRQGDTVKPTTAEVNSSSSTSIVTSTATPSVTPTVSPAERLPEDEVYKDSLNWNPQWLQEQGSNSVPPPVVHGKQMLTNLPIYKDYDSYKNTFYPLMLLELWASIFQDSMKSDNLRNRTRQGTESIGGNTEFLVGIEGGVESTHFCPLLLNPNQHQSNSRRQKSAAEADGKSNNQSPFFHVIRLVALVNNRGGMNRERDFGTVSFDFKRSTGDIKQFTFFSFFQEPQYEDINSMTIIPACLEPYRHSKSYKVTVTAVTHIKYDVQKLLLGNVARMKKISYISPKIRDFRALAQLPDSTLFQHILSPPTCNESDILKVHAVPRCELVASVYENLNPVQRSVVHHISRRIVNIQGADMMLLHGPAGTGKTKTIVGLLMQLTMDYRNNSGKQLKILVCTPSNTAVDEIIRKLTQQTEGLKIVRIGSGAVSEDTKKYMIEEAAKPYLSKTGQIDSINQSIAGVDRKIENATAEIVRLKGADEKRNNTVMSSLQANIAEWQRDRQMYLCDLSTVGLIAENLIAARINSSRNLEDPDINAFIEVSAVLKHLLLVEAEGDGEICVPLVAGDIKENLQATLAENCTNAVNTLPKQKEVRLDLALSLNATCHEVLNELVYATVNLTTVKAFLRQNSELNTPLEDLFDLVDKSEIQNYTTQFTDHMSEDLLPAPFLKSLTPVETGSDGNCFYRAISLIIFGVEGFHELVRVRILLDVLMNFLGYRNFTMRAHTEDNYEGLVRSIVRDGAHAGDVVIYAVSKILRRPIHVYTDFPNAPNDDSAFMKYMGPGNNRHRRILFDDQFTNQKPVCIHYRSSVKGGLKNHFVALMPKNNVVFPCNMDEYVQLRKFAL